MIAEEIKQKIELLRDDLSDEALNYLNSISPTIGAPHINAGCWCKQSSKVEWNRRFYMWYDTVKNLE